MSFEHSLGLHLRTSHEQSQRLTKAQQQELTQLMQLRQELHSPPPPEARRGLDGIGEARRILQERGLRGVLIGGLATEIWKTGNIESLNRHKDVDIAVMLTDNNIDIQPFEGGIDWWLPRTARISAQHMGIRVDGNHTWLENANGVVIGYTIHEGPHAHPGYASELYIPTPAFIERMRKAEIYARCDLDNVGVSDAAAHSLEQRIGKEVNPYGMSIDGLVPLPLFVAYRYGQNTDVRRIPEHHALPAYPHGLSLNQIVAINGHKTA